MKIPDKVRQVILDEANKNAFFSWYSGWNRTSGYIKSNLYGDKAYGSVRIYIEWKKKKDPTAIQIKEQIAIKIDEFLEGKEHQSRQRDFTSYMLSTFYVDVKRLESEAMMSLQNCLSDVLKALEKYDDFEMPRIQTLFNDLKNLECGINDHSAIADFMETK